MDETLRQRLERTWSDLADPVMAFANRLVRRTIADKALQNAASLAYTTLLALVPLMTVSIAVLAAFPVGDRLVEQLQDFVFDNFVPAAGEAIQEYLLDFTRNAARMTGPGFFFLVVTALLLMSSIDQAFNDIWRVRRKRRPVAKFLVYWAVITVGPLLMGVSVALSSYLLSLPLLSDSTNGLGGYRDSLLRLTPSVASAVAFTLLYMLVPLRRVPFRDALVGGITAALLFELAKKGFGIYLSYFPTYQAIYGAVATIPIFLIWIFLSWLVTLFGAEITYCLSGGGGKRRERPAFEITAITAVLQVLWQRQKSGGAFRLEKLARQVKMSLEDVDSLLGELHRHRWVVRTEDGLWMLARDLGTLRLWDLYDELPVLLPRRRQLEQAAPPETDSLAQRLTQADEELASVMDVPLTRLFEQGAAG
ncbi:MAG: virulence factor BrkB family protein [Pseudomonadota bacterium]